MLRQYPPEQTLVVASNRLEALWDPSSYSLSSGVGSHHVLPGLTSLDASDNALVAPTLAAALARLSGSKSGSGGDGFCGVSSGPVVVGLEHGERPGALHRRGGGGGGGNGGSGGGSGGGIAGSLRHLDVSRNPLGPGALPLMLGALGGGGGPSGGHLDSLETLRLAQCGLRGDLGRAARSSAPLRGIPEQSNLDGGCGGGWLALTRLGDLDLSSNGLDGLGDLPDAVRVSGYQSNVQTEQCLGCPRLLRLRFPLPRPYALTLRSHCSLTVYRFLPGVYLCTRRQALAGGLMLLRSLDLSNNDLREVPPPLGLLSSLNSLRLEGNPQRGVRSGTIAQGAAAVLASLRQKLPADCMGPDTASPGVGIGGGASAGSAAAFPSASPSAFPSGVAPATGGVGALKWSALRVASPPVHGRGGSQFPGSGGVYSMGEGAGRGGGYSGPDGSGAPLGSHGHRSRPGSQELASAAVRSGSGVGGGGGYSDVAEVLPPPLHPQWADAPRDAHGRRARGSTHTGMPPAQIHGVFGDPMVKAVPLPVEEQRGKPQQQPWSQTYSQSQSWSPPALPPDGSGPQGAPSHHQTRAARGGGHPGGPVGAPVCGTFRDDGRGERAYCATCGGSDRLEPDADNPTDVYCTPCWEVYDLQGGIIT